MSPETSRDYLQSHEEIKNNTEYTNALTLMDKPEKAQQTVETMQKNEEVLQQMETFLKPKIDALLIKNPLIDNEAKMLLAYEGLQRRWLDNHIPADPAELHIRALRTQEYYQSLDKFENRNPKSVTLTDASLSPQSREFDLNFEKMTIDTGNSSVNDFLKKTGMEAIMTRQKQSHHLQNLLSLTSGDDQPTENKILHKQLQAKQESIRNHQSPSTNMIEYFSKNTEKLTTFLKDNHGLLNTPATNPDMADFKQELVDIATSLLPDNQQKKQFREKDISRDDGIHESYLNEKKITTFSTPKLNYDNITIAADGKSMTNTISGKTVHLDQNLFQKADEKEKNKNALQEKYHTAKQAFMEERVKKQGYTKETIEKIPDQERDTMRRQAETDYLINLCTTKDTPGGFDVMTELYASDERGDNNRRLYESEGQLRNDILKAMKLPSGTNFDCTSGNTTMTIEKGKIILTQGQNSVTITHNNLEVHIVEPNPQDIANNEQVRQTAINSIQPPSNIDKNNPHNIIKDFYPDHAEYNNRLPDLLIAFDRIRHPEIDKDGNHNLNLNNLSLTSKDLVLLNATIAGLDEVKGGYRVNFQDNNLDSVPTSLLTNKNIPGLDVSNNQLETLPKLDTATEEDLKHLASLNLGNNNIAFVPELLEKFSSLTSLDLGGNRLRDAEKIGSLTALQSSLTSLSLDRCGLSSIPDSIGNLANLESLDFSSNTIDKLPGNLAKCKNITHLNLNHNKLSGVLDCTFAEKMKSLSVSDNPGITSIPNIAPSAKETLTSLSINNTKIKALPASFENTYPNLKSHINLHSTTSGSEAKNNFLDGSLTRHGYEFDPKDIKTVAKTFDATEKIMYATGSSIDDAKAQLGLGGNEKPLATATATIGEKTYTYIFAQAVKGNHWS